MTAVNTEQWSFTQNSKSYFKKLGDCSASSFQVPLPDISRYTFHEDRVIFSFNSLSHLRGTGKASHLGEHLDPFVV